MSVTTEAEQHSLKTGDSTASPFKEAEGRGLVAPAHWASLLGEVRGMGAQELLRRFESARRIIQEQGVTYNVYGDAQGMERPWELDPTAGSLAPPTAGELHCPGASGRDRRGPEPAG
jgi:uncharacterized circularly permuted ATP-grasp superfamily protein